MENVKKLGKITSFTLIIILIASLTVNFPYDATAQEFRFKFGSLGSGNGQFNFPEGIALDSSGNIYVPDTSNHRVQKFNSVGAFQLKFGANGGDGTAGTGEGQFDRRDVHAFEPGTIESLCNGRGCAVADRNRVVRAHRTGRASSVADGQLSQDEQAAIWAATRRVGRRFLDRGSRGCRGSVRDVPDGNRELARGPGDGGGLQSSDSLPSSGSHSDRDWRVSGPLAWRMSRQKRRSTRDGSTVYFLDGLDHEVNERVQRAFQIVAEIAMAGLVLVRAIEAGGFADRLGVVCDAVALNGPHRLDDVGEMQVERAHPFVG